MKIAIIPARGGSKRIPRKNIKIFCGKPIIAWTIQAARDTGVFDHIIVTTDDAEIARFAIELGAECPFIRPAELADDFTGTAQVVKHAVKWVQQNMGPVNYVCTIYPTAPFVLPSDLIESLRKLQSSGKEIAFSVTSFAFPIQRALKISDSGNIEMFHPEHRTSRSQDLEPAFHDAGQFYWAKIRAILDDTPAFGPSGLPIILPRYRVQDIDTPEDWERAEFMYRAINNIEN